MNTVDVFRGSEQLGLIENAAFPVVPHEKRIIVGIMYILISISGILGNILVIFAVAVSRKLQTYTNMFVVNLSIADLLACLMMELQCVAMFSRDDVYPYPEQACAVIASVLCISCGSSLYTLASISLYRLVLLTDTSRYRAEKLQTLHCAILWIGLSWLLPLLVNLLTPVFGAEQFGYNEKYHVCGAQAMNRSANNHEIEIAQVFGLYIPAFIVIILSYVIIFFIIHRHTVNTIREMTDSDVKNTTSSVFNRSWSWKTTSAIVLVAKLSNDNTTQLKRRQITITKNMFYVVLAFTICITPYSICLLFPELNGLLYSGILLMFNSCINPVLYGFKHPHFREVFKLLLSCQWNKIPEKSAAFKMLVHNKYPNALKH